MRDSTKRFSNRVSNYARFRPSYPIEIMSLLSNHCGLNNNCDIADIGSGTGKFTELLVVNCRKVYAVEPNAKMRASAESSLCRFDNFISIDATAENTGLDNHSVDIITVAQAFHWFNEYKVRVEFERILKPHGWVILIWNNRRKETDFEKAYEELISHYATKYPYIKEEGLFRYQLSEFYAPGSYKLEVFPNFQEFNFRALKGRIQSSSFIPTEVDPKFKLMIAELQHIFNSYSKNGIVRFNYNTEVFYGRFS